MRIISGIYRGRRIKFPDTGHVRPTTDRVKESIFNFLNNHVDFEGIKAADIYSGSGSLGLETLSRGASEAHFIEKNYPVVKILKQNIASLEADKSCRIFKMEAVKFSRLKEHDSYDLILADPPFFKDDIHEVAANILKNGFLKEDGIMLIERSVQTREKDIEKFGIEPYKKMGDSLLYLFGKRFSE